MQKLLSNNRTLARILFAAAALPLAGALTSQYGFGMKPCELCIMQRIPYGVIMFFAFLTIIKPNLRLLVTTMVIAIHAFLIDAGIAFYHIGVEKHWWVHGDCSSKLDYSSADSLRKSLFETPVVRCDEVQFEFMSLSMAGWNFIYALVAGIFTIYILVKYFKYKKANAAE